MPEWQKIFEAEYATVGIILLNRLAKRCGMIIDSDVYAFHGSEGLADVEPANLRELGYSGNKARTISDPARSVSTGRLNLEELERLDNAKCVEGLVAIKGASRTAEYVLLRGLGRIDAFPGDDAGAQNSLERRLHLKNNLTQRNGTGSEQVEKLRRFDLHPSSLEGVERRRNFRTHGWRTSSSECLNLRRNDVQ